MYFKTKRTTETGIKLTKVFDKIDLCRNAQNDFLSKYNFETGRGDRIAFAGGISSFINPSFEPDLKIWKKDIRGLKGEYFPKANCKEGKRIIADIKELPRVSVTEINIAVGYNQNFLETIGFSRSNDELYGFSVGDNWIYNKPEDCEEITKTEYDKLKVIGKTNK